MAAVSSSSEASSGGRLFDDIFEVLEVNPEGKKFEKGACSLPKQSWREKQAVHPSHARSVTRLVCRATTLDVDMIVDIANEVYSLEKESRFAMHLTSTLRKDGRPDDDAFDQSGRESLLDDFDYGMCGRVFQYDVRSGQV